MKLVINKDRSVIPIGTWGTKNENDYEILEFEFPEELENYNKRIVYYLDDTKPWDAIVDNKAYITNAITSKENVKAYIWCTKENSERPADTDFRSQEFEMHFYENENADGIVPTPVQVDGFNTMLTAMNAKIDEVDALEQTIETAEAERQENENTRISNESTRQSNESTRESNEETRQSQEAERERRTDEAIADIEDKTAEYNANAEEKTNEFNTNATQKTNEFNSNYTQKVNDFNSNATTQKTDFNTNASSKTSAFNSNAETKTNAFNTNATSKTNAFNSNASEKTTTFDNNASTKTLEFNTNAESKTSAFNDNATQKTTNFDNNASEKTDEFNTNAQEKIDEYDEHIVEYQAQIDELQEEVDELSENMPWNTTEQATEISVDDAAKYSRNKLELFGNTEQTIINLPSGYTQLDYIESTGTQFINLDYLVKQNTKLEIEYQTERIGGNTLFGASNNNMNYYASGLAGSTSQTGQDYPTTIKVSTNLSTEKTSLLWERAQVTYNGNVVTGNFGLDNSRLVLFKNRRWQNDPGKVKLYKFIAYDGNIIAANYIPCKNGNNDVGLYDVVSNTFYGNSGTGDLVAGNEITIPSPDYPQPIHVVTGNNTIEVQGKNSFDKNVERKNAYPGGEIGEQIAYVNSNATYSYVKCAYLEAGKTYTISWHQNIAPASKNDRVSRIIDENNINLALFTSWHSNSNSISYTPSVSGYLVLSTDINSTNIMIEEGSTATSYVPYYHADYPINLGNIKLCKIDTNQYNIFKNTQGSEYYSSTLIENAWYYIPIFFQEINNADSFNRKTCEGDSSKFHYIMSLNSDIQLVNSNYKQTGLINYGKVNQPARQTGRGLYQGFNLGVKLLYLYTDEDSALTLEQFKAKWNEKLQNIPIQVYALKEDRTPVQITDETLISQLDEIYEHLKLVKGTNNITVTAEDIAPNMQLSYMQDLQSKLDNLDSRLALLE